MVRWLTIRFCLCCVWGAGWQQSSLAANVHKDEPPNILVVIADDQSWPHAGAYGCESVKTPTFDRIAKQGALFTHAFCVASQCSPSRATLQLELTEQGDPQMLGFGEIFDSYPCFSPMNSSLPGFKRSGEDNPAFWPASKGSIPRLD